jgi:hypothetical protein
LLCQASNMIIIHYTKSTEETTRHWVNTKCSGIPIIFVERDSHLMDLPQNFHALIDNNFEKTDELIYGMP